MKRLMVLLISVSNSAGLMGSCQGSISVNGVLFLHDKTCGHVRESSGPASALRDV